MAPNCRGPILSGAALSFFPEHTLALRFGGGVEGVWVVFLNSGWPHDRLRRYGASVVSVENEPPLVLVRIYARFGNCVKHNGGNCVMNMVDNYGLTTRHGIGERAVLVL